jgi:hypothetical protein
MNRRGKAYRAGIKRLTAKSKLEGYDMGEDEAHHEFVEELMRESRLDLYPVTNGPRFYWGPRHVVKKSPTLGRLAAKAVGDALRFSGVDRGLQWLKQLPYPKALVKLVHPWLTLSEGEWMFFVSEERRWPTTDPEGVRLKRLIRHYTTLYPNTKAQVAEELL